jgi:hypothetical protein
MFRNYDCDIERRVYESGLGRYIDIDFLPIRDNAIKADDNREIYWKRLDEDVKMRSECGKWTDCTPSWLRILCAVINEREEILNRVLIDKEYKKNGVYRLRMYEYGIQKNITIDDYLPYFTRND